MYHKYFEIISNYREVARTPIFSSLRFPKYNILAHLLSLCVCIYIYGLIVLVESFYEQSYKNV